MQHNFGKQQWIQSTVHYSSKVDDAIEADKVFDHLMGEEVEPTPRIYRRKCRVCEKFRYLRNCVTGGL